MIKRGRRIKAEIDAVKAAILQVLGDGFPMTVRQTYYQLVSIGAIEKTEAEYQGTVVRLLTEMRRAGLIPWHWITDHTRYRRKPATFSNPQEAIEETARFYRRALWSDIGVHVEIWLEKEALIGVLDVETSLYDVPLMVTKGYPSITFLHGAGQEIAAEGKPTWIYYFGDLDPSGVDIPLKVEAGLREFAPTAEIHFERVAVLPEQIAAMRLPTRPTKASDSRSRSFDGESVEVDAIPPKVLRQLCRDRILAHISPAQIRVHEQAERSDRQLLQAWVGDWGAEA